MPTLRIGIRWRPIHLSHVPDSAFRIRCSSSTQFYVHEVWRRRANPRVFSQAVVMRRLKSQFGMEPDEIAELWNMMEIFQNLDPGHIFWFLTTLDWLKGYNNIGRIANHLDHDPQTVRHHIWEFIDRLNNMELARKSCCVCSLLHCI